MKLIKSKDRYLTQISWLKSFHSFSFGEHIHPENKGWGNLRVINEDFIAPGGHFDRHPHRDMEIVSYIVKGELHHKDSEGNEYTINENEVQRISAGSGILHSETNPSTSEETILLQLWIKPKVKQTKPDYKQKKLDKAQRLNKLQLIASEDGRNGSIDIKQDLEIYASLLDKKKTLVHQVQHQKAWLQIIEGQIEVNDQILESGDGIGLENEKSLVIKANKDSHFLLFDING
jgi:redox-sensitive bicupin YhaK (pirin superfamily)